MPEHHARKFFERKTLTVARELLGKFLVRGNRSAMITETEAYIGSNDLACHASKGRTKRTEVMFGPAGHAYIYLIYGMYYCLNVVTEREEYPAAVLIRGVQIENVNIKMENDNAKFKIDGPGKLTRYFKIDKSLNGEDMTKSKKLWIEDRGVIIPRSRILTTTRIGVDYAGEWKNKKWRFVLKSTISPRPSLIDKRGSGT